ncbi:hypothetical protein [Dokdonella sp.]|uniref:hypothetical protein n=1 Tax=Dokdonella sp. TaxID=2291710 RepID=UPI001B1235BF|nr:hypothetical protein [Dokdonella sp.]MBO9662982.1 hypothetical protein [Dokdonella sp.]
MLLAGLLGGDQPVRVMWRPSTTDGYAELIVHIHASEGNAGYVAKIQQANVRLYRGAEYQGQAPHGVDPATQALTLRLANGGGRVRVCLNGSAQPLLELVDPDPIVDGAQRLNIYANGDTSRHWVGEFRYS